MITVHVGTEMAFIAVDLSICKLTHLMGDCQKEMNSGTSVRWVTGKAYLHFTDTEVSGSIPGAARFSEK
jgi:hypothetical protein